MTVEWRNNARLADSDQNFLDLCFKNFEISDCLIIVLLSNRFMGQKILQTLLIKNGEVFLLTKALKLCLQVSIIKLKQRCAGTNSAPLFYVNLYDSAGEFADNINLLIGDKGSRNFEFLTYSSRFNDHTINRSTGNNNCRFGIGIRETIGLGNAGRDQHDNRK